MERPTFSQNWSRVSRLTPTLRPQVQIQRQLFRGEPWHVVHDPISNNFFRLNPVAYHFVGLLDGRRSVDDAWRITLENFGDAAPTQNEVIGLLGQLNQSNLLRVDLPADAEPLLRRNRERRLKHWTGQAMSILFLRFPLFNPNKMLDWLTPIFRPILNKWLLIAWVAWMVYALVIFLPKFPEFLRDVDSVLDPNNWLWMAVLFVVIKAIHELGHGLVCKRFGGVVPEVGIMLLVLFPAPYVDATSSWNFPDKWKRLLVAAAGMIFELAIAAGAAVIWVYAEEQSLLQQLAYNAVFLASVTTILFNGNPLLRFDGYYMLSDMLEVPNLYDRSTRHLKYLCQKYLFGMTNARPIATSIFEQWAMTLYGIAAMLYRFFIMFGIVLFISGKLLIIGIALALWTVFSWICIPLGKLVHWLVTSPALVTHRARAISVCIAIAAGLILGIGVLPVRDHRTTQGVVEAVKQTNVEVATAGFVEQVLVDSGDHVAAGDPLIVIVNKDLEVYQRQLEARLNQLALALDQAVAQDRVAERAIHEEIAAARGELAEVRRRLDASTVRAPQTGRFVGANIKQLIGRFVERGQLIGRVSDIHDLRVVALLPQAQNAALSNRDERIAHVEMRIAGRIERILHIDNDDDRFEYSQSGQLDLPHPALGRMGGGNVATAPDDEKGVTALRPQFAVRIPLPRPQDLRGYVKGLKDNEALANPILDPPAYLGQRVYLRFTLEKKKPLMQQWIRSIRQLIRDRVSV